MDGSKRGIAVGQRTFLIVPLIYLRGKVDFAEMLHLCILSLSLREALWVSGGTHLAFMTTYSGLVSRMREISRASQSLRLPLSVCGSSQSALCSMIV